TAPEDVGEGRHDVFGIAEVVDPRPFKPGVAVTVVPLALGLVGQNFVGLGTFLESLLSLGIPRVLAGMILETELPIGPLDLLDLGGAGYAEDFIVISLRCHRHGVSSRVGSGRSVIAISIPKSTCDATPALSGPASSCGDLAMTKQ